MPKLSQVLHRITTNRRAKPGRPFESQEQWERLATTDELAKLSEQAHLGKAA